MPFTLAHPAAIIPFARLAGKRTSLSALVIGSMIPDMVYFLPLGISGRTSHSLPALFWFCLPVGLVAYALFHSFVKRPATALLPQQIIRRLPLHVLEGPWYGPSPAGMVMLSLFIGALTHVTWDSFTHAHTDVVAQVEVLRSVIAVVGGYPVPLYKAMQHVSSLVGLAALAWWIRAWFAGSGPTAGANQCVRHSLSKRSRIAVVTAIAATAMTFGIAKGARTSYRAVEHVVVQMTVGGMIGAGIASTAFCLGWHLIVARRNRYA